MRPKLETLVVSLALAVTSVHASAAIEAGGKRVPSGDLLSSGIAWSLGSPADRITSQATTSRASATSDPVWTAALLPTAYSSAAVYGVAAADSVSAAEGSGARATVAFGTRPAVVIRGGSNTRSSTKPRTADSSSASGFSAVGSAIEENFNSSDERRLSAATALSVPEPGKWAVALAGLLGVGAIARRRMSS